MVHAALASTSRAVGRRTPPRAGACSTLTLQQAAGNAAVSMLLRRSAALPVQRTIGDGHDLTSPRFAGDLDLEACYDDEARLTMGGLGQPGTTKVERGPAVRKVNEALIELGLLAGTATDAYTRATWNAVKALKAREHLGWETMGDVGPGTMAWLDRHFAPPAPTPPPGPAPGPAPAPCPPCPTPGPRPAGCAPCPPPTDHIQDCNATDTTSVAAARVAAVTELNSAISAASARPLTTTLRQALWLAFRTNSVPDADAVVAKLRDIRSGLPGATVECEGPDFHFCPAGALGYTRPITHVIGHGNIHVCTAGWNTLSAAQQAETLIHEGSHRFNGTNDDGGYFSLEGDESGETAGQSRAVRLDNADSYTAFAIYLTRKPAADIEDRGEQYRGNRLAVEQDPVGPIERAGDPATPVFRVRGNPDNSAFTFRWVIADAQDRRYLMRASSGDPFQFGPHVEVFIGRPTRDLLTSRGVTAATVLVRSQIPEATDRLFSIPVVFR